jgi:hypothetical protein
VLSEYQREPFVVNVSIMVVNDSVEVPQLVLMFLTAVTTAPESGTELAVLWNESELFEASTLMNAPSGCPGKVQVEVLVVVPVGPELSELATPVVLVGPIWVVEGERARTPTARPNATMTETVTPIAILPLNSDIYRSPAYRETDRLALCFEYAVLTLERASP